MDSKPTKGIVRYWPTNLPQVGQPLIGEHEAHPGQDFMSSKIVDVHRISGGLEVETLNARYIAVPAR